VHGHVNKQLTNHSSATEREIAEEYRSFLSSKLVARLVKSWITCDVRHATLLNNKVARQSCSTLLRVCDGLYVNKLSEVTGRGKHFNSSSSQLLRGNPTGRHMLKQYKFPELSIGASGDSDRYILYDNIRPRN